MQEDDASLISYAAMTVPVSPRHVWNCCAICWQYSGAGSQWRLGRKYWAMGPYAERIGGGAFMRRVCHMRAEPGKGEINLTMPSGAPPSIPASAARSPAGHGAARLLLGLDMRHGLG
jgi:hypothetical protein